MFFAYDMIIEEQSEFYHLAYSTLFAKKFFIIGGSRY